MTDADTLRAAVLARPDDDTPRLAFADYLDEHGDADRAAVIRHQVAAARAEPDSPSARAATAAADRLLAAHQEQWTGHLPERLSHTTFARGFVGHVSSNAWWFPADAPAVFELEPVRAVRLLKSRVLDECPSLLPALSSPELARVSRLDLASAGMFPDIEEWNVLTTAKHLIGLRELSLHDTPITPSWLTELIAGPGLPSLAVLDLAGITNAGPAIAAGITRANHRRFAGLDLTGVVFRSSDALRRVLSAKCLEDVRELRLAHVEGAGSGGPLKDLNIGWVVPWRSLRVLDVSGHRIGAEGVKEIARCPEAKHLRRLGLRHNGIGAEGVAALVASLHLHLYHLDVRGNGLGPAEVGELRQRFPDAVIEADPPRPAIRGRT